MPRGRAGPSVTRVPDAKEETNGAVRDFRRSGWRSPEELQAAAERSTAEGERLGDVRWIRSYVLDEGNGLGTVCIYEAESPEALRRHAAAADLPSTRSSRSQTP